MSSPTPKNRKTGDHKTLDTPYPAQLTVPPAEVADNCCCASAFTSASVIAGAKGTEGTSLLTVSGAGEFYWCRSLCAHNSTMLLILGKLSAW